MIISLPKAFVCQRIKPTRKNNTPSWGRTSGVAPSSGSGGQGSTGRQQRESQSLPLHSQLRVGLQVSWTVMDIWLRTACICFSHPHTSSDGSNQLPSFLPTATRACEHLRETWHTQALAGQIRCFSVHQRKLPEGEMLRGLFNPVSPVRKEMGDWKAVSSKTSLCRWVLVCLVGPG